jgi:hypothetical protein
LFQATRPGLEAEETPENEHISSTDGAESGALGGEIDLLDTDLADLISELKRAWNSGPIRAHPKQR